jgi:hypothetical protein
MRPPYHTLNRKQVHQSATGHLQNYVPMRDYKRKVSTRTLWAVLLVAATGITSIHACCERLGGIASEETIRKALIASLPELAELQRQLNHRVALADIAAQAAAYSSGSATALPIGGIKVSLTTTGDNYHDAVLADAVIRAADTLGTSIKPLSPSEIVARANMSPTTSRRPADPSTGRAPSSGDGPGALVEDYQCHPTQHPTPEIIRVRRSNGASAGRGSSKCPPTDETPVTRSTGPGARSHFVLTSKFASGVWPAATLSFNSLSLPL